MLLRTLLAILAKKLVMELATNNITISTSNKECIIIIIAYLHYNSIKFIIIIISQYIFMATDVIVPNFLKLISGHQIKPQPRLFTTPI